MSSRIKEKILIGYVACGPTYRESAYKQLKDYYFDDDNFYYYVLTDDKNYFRGLERKNLEVKELKDYYTIFPKTEQNESFLESTSKTDYAEKCMNSNWLFPFSTYRFALHYAVELGITNVALLNTDATIKCELLTDDFFDKKDYLYNAMSQWDEYIWNHGMHRIAHRLQKHYGLIPDKVVTVLDAAARMYVAKDIEKLKLFFNLWNEIVEFLYEDGFMLQNFRGWYAINDEYVLAPIYNVLDLNKRKEGNVRYLPDSYESLFSVKHNSIRERFWKTNDEGIIAGTNWEEYLKINNLEE